MRLSKGSISIGKLKEGGVFTVRVNLRFDCQGQESAHQSRSVIGPGGAVRTEFFLKLSDPIAPGPKKPLKFCINSDRPAVRGSLVRGEKEIILRVKIWGQKFLNLTRALDYMQMATTANEELVFVIWVHMKSIFLKLNLNLRRRSHF